MTYDETNGTNPGDAALARELGAALRQASTGFQPDPEALAEAGLRRGRTRLWRRRAASVTAVAAVAAVGLGATTLTGLTGDDDEGGPVESLTAAPWSEEDLADTLAARLPDGVEVVESDGAGTDETGDPWVSLTLEDAAGEPWTLSFDLMRWISDDWTQLAGCVEDWSDCEEQTLEDGWILTAYHGVEEAIAAETEDVVGDTGEDAPAAPESFATWGAWLEGPAEWAPDVTGAYAYSLTLMPGEAVTGPVAGAGTDAEPPLTEDELAAILRDPVWRDVHVEADAEPTTWRSSPTATSPPRTSTGPSSASPPRAWRSPRCPTRWTARAR
jgi:hypothetical protein